jgi:hypothetical protein
VKYYWLEDGQIYKHFVKAKEKSAAIKKESAWCS